MRRRRGTGEVSTPRTSSALCRLRWRRWRALLLRRPCHQPPHLPTSRRSGTSSRSRSQPPRRSSRSSTEILRSSRCWPSMLLDWPDCVGGYTALWRSSRPRGTRTTGSSPRQGPVSKRRSVPPRRPAAPLKKRLGWRLRKRRGERPRRPLARRLSELPQRLQRVLHSDRRPRVVGRRQVPRVPPVRRAPRRLRLHLRRATLAPVALADTPGVAATHRVAGAGRRSPAEPRHSLLPFRQEPPERGSACPGGDEDQDPGIGRRRSGAGWSLKQKAADRGTPARDAK